MNVTIKIDERLVKSARHRAVDEGLSLSGWVARVIRKEVAGTNDGGRRSLLETLGSEDSGDCDIEFRRDESVSRDIDFS